MNQVSDGKLALAVEKAGAMPSLFYESSALLRKELEIFNDSNIIITVCCDDLLDAMPILLEYRITHVELYGSYKNLEPSLIISLVKYLKNKNVKILFKQPAPNEYLLPYLDAVVLKGNEGAGTILQHSETIDSIIPQYKNTPVVATGGVSSYEKMNELLILGAMSVGIGTLFAVSQESKISYATKLKMIQNESMMFHQRIYNWKRYIQIGNLEQNDDYNMTNNLLSAVNGNDGIVYAGKGIESVNSILTVEQIIKKLMAPAQGIEP